MMRQIAVLVTESSQVAEARRHAVALAKSQDFSEERAGAVALVVTEAATNLIKHGGGGTILLQPLAVGGGGEESASPGVAGAKGVELIALDRGRGMANVAASLRDGHSTAGSPGLGLGALSRVGSDFDVYSQPGAGTVLRCVVWADKPPPPNAEVESGVVCVPMNGESVAGDDWALRACKGRYVLLIVDGLGHGPEAAHAAAEARRVVEAHIGRTTAEHVEAMHAALRSTRGAAAAVIELKPSAQVGTFCGIGNIGCFVRAEGKSRSLASHGGILGHHLRKVQPFSFPFPRRSLLFAYSDGMTSRWDPGTYTGLESRHPALIAGALYRDHNRGRDDTTLAVVRNVREA